MVDQTNPGRETLQRARRIETRLTQLMIALGVQTDTQKPYFNEGSIIAPSQRCSLQELIDSIPVSWQGPVTVFVGADRIAELRR